MPGLVERSVFQGSTTLVHVRLAHGPSLQVLVANGGREDPPKDGSAVTVVMPPGALRLLTRAADPAETDRARTRARRRLTRTVDRATNGRTLAS